MTNTQKNERKKYRDTFLIYALLGAVGIALGMYVFKYTDILSGKATGYAYVCRMDLKELLSRYYSEFRYVVLLFLSGFTVFAVPCAIVFSFARGFICSVGILRLSAAINASGADKAQLVITVCALSAVFAVELIMASKAARCGAHLETVVPRPGVMARDRYIRAYVLTFALLCAFLLVCVACVYLAPLLPFYK